MVDYSKKLSKEERTLIVKHHKFYQSLETGQRKPTTAEQKHFVDVCQGNAQPKTEHEIAYAKFIGIYAPRKNEKILDRNDLEWEGKLRKLQEVFENNKIKEIRFSKYKSPEKRKEDKEGKHSINQLDRKIVKKQKYPHEQKQKNQVKDSPTEKVILNTKAHIKSEDEIKKEILEKAKKRSELTEYYKNKMSKSKSEIPEYEEGYPKPDWFTDEDWKRMKGQDYADMKKHHHD